VNRKKLTLLGLNVPVPRQGAAGKTLRERVFEQMVFEPAVVYYV